MSASEPRVASWREREPALDARPAIDLGFLDAEDCELRAQLLALIGHRLALAAKPEMEPRIVTRRPITIKPITRGFFTRRRA